MPSNPSDGVDAHYELACTDCPFETVVIGVFEQALTEADAHRRDREAGPRDHFVNVHRRF